MKRTAFILFSSLLFTVGALNAQEAPFSRGVNLTGWFQVGSAQQIQFTKYTKKDFEQIQSLGCDVIRLPINLHFMTNGAPNYTLSPLFLSFLDQAVDWAEELGLHLILDNHTFDPAANTDPNVGVVLKKVWTQMATHYKDRSNLIYYEVLNEPHGISDAAWNSIQQEVIDAIRAVDTEHTIIVGGAGWNSYNNLAAIPEYTDENLIYTFHFYDPFLFTHQGATWVGIPFDQLSGVPFPWSAGAMPPLPSGLVGTWGEDQYNNYATDGTVAKVKQLIDIAVAFRDTRNVPVFCGEFGVYIPNSDPEDRVYWYQVVREYLEEKGIAWTSWDYHGGFGLFEAGSNGLFEHDLNVPLIEALGLTAPEQTEYILLPDTTGFLMYSDYIESMVFESSYSNGMLNYYSTAQPNNGEYCIFWADADQYNTVGFDFIPNKDLSVLVANGFALDLMVRGDTPGVSFDLRFIDTKTETTGDHPWRMGITIDESMAPGDSYWHHLHIPLDDLEEKGSWDNGWFPPQGAFDWKAVDRFEIVSEQNDLQGKKLWFDNIQVTDLDTAMIYVTTPIVTTQAGELVTPSSLKIFPNPARNFLCIDNHSRSEWNYRLLDGNGKTWCSGLFSEQVVLDISLCPSGLYWLQLTDGYEISVFQKVLKL